MRKIRRFGLRWAAMSIVLLVAKEVIAQGVAAGIKEAFEK